jgi:hypothetical protein
MVLPSQCLKMLFFQALIFNDLDQFGTYCIIFHDLIILFYLLPPLKKVSTAVNHKVLAISCSFWLLNNLWVLSLFCHLCFFYITPLPIVLVLSHADLCGLLILPGPAVT